MKHRFLPFLACVSALCLLIGCASSAVSLAPPAPDRPWRDAPPPSDGVLSTPPKFEIPADIAPAPYDHADAVKIDAKHVYTLPELIDLAERNNPDTRIAWEQSKQAAAAVGLAQAAYLPQISAEALGGMQHVPTPMPKALVPKGYVKIDTEEVLPSLVIKWLLFDFGGRAGKVEVANRMSLAANMAFTGAHQKLIFEVSKAYFALDAVRAQLHVAEDSLKNARILEEAAEAKRKSGLATTVDLAVARRGTAKARFDLEQARAAGNDAYYALMEAMGLPPTLKMKAAESTGRAFPKNIARNVDDYIGQALAHRPDIAAVYAKLKASEGEIESAKAAYYPTLGFEGGVSQNIGSLSIDGGPNYRVNQPASALLFQLKLPLYDGGMRESALAIARSQQSQAREELKKTQDEAIRQVARAYDATKSALAQYDAALALTKASDTANGAALDAYKQGVGTFTDAVTAQTQKTQARAVKAQAYAAVLTNAAALAFATGGLTSAEALDSKP